MRLSDRFLYFYLPKYHHLFFKSKQVVLVNSIQKAGTHMLVNALAKSLPIKYNQRGIYDHALVHTWPSAKAEKNTTPATVVQFLANNAWPGELLRGHIEYDGSIADVLKSKSIPHVMIIRKPLDVLLSLANWWERHNEIQVNAFLVFKQIERQEERLMYLLTGNVEGNQVWPNFIERYAAFLGWIKNENTFLVRFEDLLHRPETVANELAMFLPLTLNKQRFLTQLKSRDNRTFTNPEEKVHQSISQQVMDEYERLGGSELEKAFGYR